MVGNHFSKVRQKLENGKLLLLFLFVACCFNLYAQEDGCNSKEIKLIGVQSVEGNLILSYWRNCPGELSGGCLRSLFLISERNHKYKEFRNAEYKIKEDEIYAILNPLYIKKFLSIAFPHDEVMKVELLKFFSNEINLWDYKLEEFIVASRGKSIIKKLPNVKSNVLMFMVPGGVLNNLYENRVLLKPTNNDIQVAVFFNDNYIEYVDRIIQVPNVP